ncbi:alpha-(1,3)-fucosyltransferase 6-like [Elysia marginata]|uniref:Fucosyltransferase n=1 Tax=Elysia marginata TaxID=1093978 RepID=A0AAV4GPT0_9GAST|nr:alpha-(1,3)-fucosyltransferase 6-like [Elysia marginata]
MMARRCPYRFCVILIGLLLTLLAIYDIILKHTNPHNSSKTSRQHTNNDFNAHDKDLWFLRRKTEKNERQEVLHGKQLQTEKQKFEEQEQTHKNTQKQSFAAKDAVIDPDLDVVVIEGKMLRELRERKLREKKQTREQQQTERQRQSGQGVGNQQELPTAQSPYPGFDPDLDVVIIKGRILKEQEKQLRLQRQSQELSKRNSEGPQDLHHPHQHHQQQQNNHHQQQQQLQKPQQQQQQQQPRHEHQENKTLKQPNTVATPVFRKQLKDIGLEPIEDHKFKSQYIVNPKIYERKPTMKISHSLPESTKGAANKTKLISFYNRPRWFAGPRHTYNMDNKMCPYSCEVDLDGSRASQADVLLIFTGYLSGSRSEPPARPPGQIWVHLFRESPVHYGYPSNYQDWKAVFNWTWTYRTDSDVFSPYGFMSWRDKDLLLDQQDYVSIAKSKTRTATMFASHCKPPSGRDTYVQEMQKHIDVDIYGACGTLRCPKSDNAVCDQKINTTYKFYLSFENSFCDDYVTEKFLRLFTGRLHVVPVVRGGADYAKFFPRGGFVNAADFSNATELALYLKKLGEDTLTYARMLKEKDKLVSSNYMLDWCDLCEKVHTDKRKKIIPDIKAWSHFDGVCSDPKDLESLRES